MNEMSQKGIITETECQLYFLKKGYMVYLPVTQDTKSDMIVEVNTKLLRIQVKTCHLTKTNTGIEISTHSMPGSGDKQGYSKQDIDFFATSYNNEIYLIPVEICSKHEKVLSFSTNPYTTVTLLEDYRADLIIEQFLQNKDFSLIITDNKKQVGQYDLNDNLIQVFESLSAAARSINKPEGLSHISAAANGKRNTAYGFKWRFI